MKMPVLFIGHGSPMNAIEENAFTAALHQLAAAIPRPKAICVISAHWVTRGARVLTQDWPPTIHDFYGFPKPLYEVQYPAPGASTEAKKLAFERHLQLDAEWGLDHGAWSVLRHLYPEADVPVFQLSLDHGRTFAEHRALGQELRGMRERGILILGSGNLVHNLHLLDWHRPDAAYDWAAEFDEHAKRAISAHDADALVSPERWGARLLGNAHPTLEHYLPLLYCAGCTDGADEVSYPYEAIEFGSISMRTVLYRNPQEQSA